MHGDLVGSEQYGTVIGRSDAEYAAPDPAEGGVVDFDDFPGLAIATSVGFYFIASLVLLGCATYQCS